MRFRDKLQRFMYGRYGFGYGSADKLNYFLLVVYFILVVVNAFVRNSPASYIISVASLLVVVYTIFRMFSKNIARRQSENMKFLKVWNRIKSTFSVTGMRFKEIKTSRFRRCPKCKATLRLPIKRGKHSVVCPNCSNRFSVHILF